MNRDPDQWSGLHGGRLAQMVAIATQAGRSTLAHFRTDDLLIEAKADASPVTVADRNAEQWVRERIAHLFPGDAVLGEEFEDTGGTSGYRWVVDPIDGTKSFIAGVPLYSTLLALEYDDDALGGVIAIPALGECVAAATGHGAWHRCAVGMRGAETVRAESGWRPAHVSSRSSLDRSVFVTSQVDSFARRDAQAAYQRLESASWITRTWGDGYGYLLVATGRADVMVDPVVNPWDVAAIRPVIEEAGGRFSDWQGKSTSRGTDAVGTNGRLHQEVLQILQRPA